VIALFLVADCSRRKLSPTRCRHRRLTSAPVLDAPLPRASRALCAALAALTKPAPGPTSFIARSHARIVRLDLRSPLPVAGVRQHLLAGRVRSFPTAAARARPRRRERLSFPTHHLRGTAPPFPVRSNPEQTELDERRQSRKDPLFRYGLIAPLYWKSAARRTDAARPRGRSRLYDIRHSSAARCRWTLYSSGRYAIAATDSSHSLPSHARTRANARRRARDRRAHRTAQRENPHRTGTALLRELAPAQAGTLSLHALSFLRARGLTERQLLLDKSHRAQKYEAEFANRIWQSDMLFGPWVRRAAAAKCRCPAATLDDASRLIPHAQFYPNQGWIRFSIACARPSPRAASPRASTWTTPRSTARLS